MRKIFTVLAGLFMVTFSYGQNVKWIVMARGGSAYNFRAPLIIKQDGYEDLRINAKYATRALAGPPYYEFNIVRWNETKGWGLKVTHHKLYLQNNPPEIQQFTITDGYNILTITRQWKIGGFIYHLGGGAVLTHPESIIRNQHLSETNSLFHSGYHLSGPAAEATIEKRVDLSKRFLLSMEGRVTGSFVKVPIVNGHAHTSNVAMHGLIGIGYKFNRK